MNKIKVCLRCFEAVVRLRRGISESILECECEYCGRMFVLEEGKECLNSSGKKKS